MKTAPESAQEGSSELLAEPAGGSWSFVWWRTEEIKDEDDESHFNLINFNGSFFEACKLMVAFLESELCEWPDELRVDYEASLEDTHTYDPGHHERTFPNLRNYKTGLEEYID